jgi:hypothetical protein
MRVLSKVLWIFAFVAATFCWMVLFEHGFSAAGFTKGIKEEIGELVGMANGEKKTTATDPVQSSQPQKKK